MAGLHRLKLALIGKSKKPRSLKNIKNLLVSYYANKSAWVNQPLFIDWYNKVFVPQARKHCKSVGFPSDCIIILTLDNCFAHPPAATFIHGKIHVMYLLPNVMSILQLMDQGIIYSLKCKYPQIFLQRMIDSCSKNILVPQFQKSFTLKDAIWACTAAQDEVAKDTLINTWRKLWPHDLFKDNDNKDRFPGFQLSAETQIITKLVDYSRQVAESGTLL